MVRISHPIRYTVAAGVALALGGLLVAFAAWGEVTRVIAERRVAEGKTIAAGAVLLVLNTERQIRPHFRMIEMEIEMRELNFAEIGALVFMKIDKFWVKKNIFSGDPTFDWLFYFCRNRQTGPLS